MNSYTAAYLVTTKTFKNKYNLKIRIINLILTTVNIINAI